MPAAHVKPESRWSSTFAQTWAIISAIVVSTAAATWFLSNAYQALIAEMKALRTEVAAVQSSVSSLRGQVVTQTQAERYAAAFKWENRVMNIAVPDPKSFQDR